VVWPN